MTGLSHIRTLRDLIVLHEGKRNESYWDFIGRCWTIGYGHTGKEVVKGLVWTDEQCERALDDDIEETRKDLEALCLHFNIPLAWLSVVRFAALMDMCFELGPGKLREFVVMWANIAQERWLGAKVAALQSRWQKQVPQRADTVAEMLGSGLWPGEEKIS